MSACGSPLDLEYESSGPRTPQATQSAPASIKEFDLPAKYLEPARRTDPRRSSEGDHPQYFESSSSQLYTPRLVACSRVTLRATGALHSTTIGSEDCPTLVLPDSMSASFVESKREDGPSQYSPPPGTPTEDVHIDLNGALSTTSDKRNMRLIAALNRQLALQDKLPRAPHPSVEDEPLNHETAVHFAETNSRKILSIPETPLEFSKFRFGSQKSFNTSVQDLYQTSPDTPIGTKVLAQKSFVTSSKGPLGSLTNFSEQLPMLKRFRKGSRSKIRCTMTNSEASSCMTAPAAYAKKRVRLATDLSYDGPAGDVPESGTSVRDFAFDPARRFVLDDRPVSPHTVLPATAIPSHSAISGFDGIFSMRRDNAEDTQPNPAQQQQPLAEMERFATGVLPIDTTDKNSAPPTPQPGKKSRRNIHTGRRMRRRALGGPIRGDDNTAPLHRRLRGKILVTPVLSVVIGRQLAKPTRKLLKKLAETAEAVPLPEGFAAIPAPI